MTRKRNDVKPVRKPNSKSKAEMKGKQVQRGCEQQGDVRLVFAPTGEPSEEAVRSVIKDWVSLKTGWRRASLRNSFANAG